MSPQNGLYKQGFGQKPSLYKQGFWCKHTVFVCFVTFYELCILCCRNTHTADCSLVQSRGSQGAPGPGTTSTSKQAGRQTSKRSKRNSKISAIINKGREGILTTAVQLNVKIYRARYRTRYTTQHTDTVRKRTVLMSPCRRKATRNKTRRGNVPNQENDRWQLWLKNPVLENLA